MLFDYFTLYTAIVFCNIKNFAVISSTTAVHYINISVGKRLWPLYDKRIPSEAGGGKIVNWNMYILYVRMCYLKTTLSQNKEYKPFCKEGIHTHEILVAFPLQILTKVSIENL